jgi:hypothetical protein
MQTNTASRLARGLSSRIKEGGEISRIEFAHSVGFNPFGWQVQALENDADRTIFNISRQGGKSITTAIIALHEAVTVPESLALIAASGETQSKELLRKVRRFCSGTTRRLIAESKTAVEFDNGSRILALCGREGAARSFSEATTVIIDEASRVSVELLDAISPTLAVKAGRLIVLSTPFGKRGFFYELFVKGGDAWERYEVPWYECPWISENYINQEKARMSESHFAQEYLNAFVETDESAFNYGDIERAFSEDVEGWDLGGPVTEEEKTPVHCGGAVEWDL